MLQTAPVLLLFPPTTGLKAKSDGAPIKYDFTQGYVTIFTPRVMLKPDQSPTCRACPGMALTAFTRRP